MQKKSTGKGQAGRVIFAVIDTAANRGEFIAQQITQGRGLRREFEQACGL